MDNESPNNEGYLLDRSRFLRIAAGTTGAVLLTACGGNTKQANNLSTKTANGNQTPRQLGNLEASTAATTPTQSIEGIGSTPTASSAPQITGSGQPTAVTNNPPQPTQALPTSFREAPALTKQVKAGKLPKVADRVPKNPMVLDPVERVGTYGGTWRSVFLGPGHVDWLIRTMGYEQMVRWDPKWTKVIPNVAESYELRQNGSEYIFKLRKGMKWSDGEPFTADDVMFWYKDVLMNKELTPAVPVWLTSDGNPVKVEAIDKYTVRFKFTKPVGLFIQFMATPRGADLTGLPAHYLKQFHKKYNPDVVQQAKNAKMDNWVNLFLQKASPWENPDLPVIYAWKLTGAVGEGTTQVIAERNPYYWKVDSQGNQLPYIDKIRYEIVQDNNVVRLKALNGEFDLLDPYFPSLSDKPLFYQHRKDGNYHLINTNPTAMNYMNFSLNLTHKDDTKRKVFQDKNFRIGLSYAMNRSEIIQVVYQGQGQPWQMAPRPDGQFPNMKLAKQYTEYDVGKANEHLDKVLPKKNSQGKRLGPDGKAFFFQVEVVPTQEPYWVDTLQLMQKYFQEVGVDMKVKSESRDLFYTRVEGNQHDASVWGGTSGTHSILDPSYFCPVGESARYAIPWELWFNNPKAKGAMEPPSVVKTQLEMYREVQSTADAKKQAELMRKIINIAREQFWLLGVALPTQDFDIVANRFHNVPELPSESMAISNTSSDQPMSILYRRRWEVIEGRL